MKEFLCKNVAGPQASIKRVNKAIGLLGLLRKFQIGLPRTSLAVVYIILI